MYSISGEFVEPLHKSKYNAYTKNRNRIIALVSERVLRYHQVIILFLVEIILKIL